MSTFQALPPGVPDRAPALAFGQGRALAWADPGALDSIMAQALGIRAAHEAPEGHAAGAGRVATQGLSGLRLLALSGPALHQAVHEATHPVLVVPLQGSLKAQGLGTGREPGLEAGAAEAALLLPPGGRSVQLQASSSLWLALEPARLAAVAASMLATEDRAHAQQLLGLQAPARVPLQAGRVHLGAVLRQLCRLLDEYAADAELLRLSACDDAFCRAVVTLLAPAQVLEQPAQEPPARLPGDTRLDAVCEHVLSRLDTRLSLSELERVGGMSARSLQYAFQQRYGCSPLAWVLEQRLQAARAELTSTRGDTTVTQVAARYFSNLGRFSAQYRQRFGELPGVTLGRLRNRRD